jgi:cardiolipin synthase
MNSEKKTVEQTYSVGNGVKRAVFAALSIILQVLVIWVLFSALREKYPIIQFLQSILAFVIVLLIYNQNRTAAMKMPWIVIIMAWPIFGTFMFLLLGLNGGTNAMKRRYREIDEKLLPKLGKGEEALAALQAEDQGLANEARYIRDFSGYPIYHNTDVVFYDDGAKGLEAQLAELKKAEKFIFMEYHAIEDTVSFGRILEVLKAKVKEADSWKKAYYEEKAAMMQKFYDYVQANYQTNFQTTWSKWLHQQQKA